MNKSEQCLRDGDLGLSIEDGKKILVALQKAVVTPEAETYVLFCLPYLSAGQGLHDTPNSNGVWHGGRFAIHDGCCVGIAIREWWAHSLPSRKSAPIG